MGRRTETDPKTGKPVVSSAGKFMGINTIFGRDGEQGGPYMTRAWFWRLRLHTFHRPDQDEDCHDHPWDFWTFPLVSYVEDVVVQVPTGKMLLSNPPQREMVNEKRRQIVPAFRISFRPATHCHRVLGRYRKWTPVAGNAVRLNEWDKDPSPGKIVTLVWISKPKRAWGFLKNREGEWCWVAWRDYIFNGGKDGPCQ